MIKCGAAVFLVLLCCSCASTERLDQRTVDLVRNQLEKPNLEGLQLYLSHDLKLINDTTTPDAPELTKLTGALKLKWTRTTDRVVFEKGTRGVVTEVVPAADCSCTKGKGSSAHSYCDKLTLSVSFERDDAAVPPLSFRYDAQRDRYVSSGPKTLLFEGKRYVLKGSAYLNYRLRERGSKARCTRVAGGRRVD